MIYKLVAPQNEIQPRRQRSQYPQGERNRLMIAQPGLFRSCGAIRAESLDVFYQLREFHILIENGSQSLKALQRWLRRMDVHGRLNIQHLRVTFKEKFDTMYVIYIEYIVKRLSEKALIVFHAGNYFNWRTRQACRWDSRILREIRATYAQINSGRVPELQESGRVNWYYPSYSQQFEVGRSRTSLAFLPRLSSHASPYTTPVKRKSPSSSPVSKVPSRWQEGQDQQCSNCGWKLA